MYFPYKLNEKLFGAFKNSLKSKGVYHTAASLIEFEPHFGKHLNYDPVI